MIDWDNLKGDKLNEPLARLAGWHGEAVWMRTTGKFLYLYPPWESSEDNEYYAQRVPDYANSVDHSIRELVPLLGPPGTWFSIDLYSPKGNPALAFARALGKALEARREP